jgi:parallel beta-helix repeat protein
MIYSVSSAGELVAAAKVAVGGDTIQLAAGTYSDVSLKGLQFTSQVTITSADPGSPAVLIDFAVSGVTGLTLQNLSFRIDNGAALDISKSESIVVDNVDVAGKIDATTGKPGGNGLRVRESTDVEITNSSFHDLGHAVIHLNVQHLLISGNTIEDIRVDGIRGGGSSWVEISNNQLSNFYRNPGEHGDAIQFWTSGTKESAHDIVVKDNLIVRGDGGNMQGIFIADESKGKLPFLNLTVTGNTVIGSSYHGISISQAKGGVVANNTVVGYEDMRAWIRIDGSTDFTLSNNIASHYSIPSASNLNLLRADNQTVPLTNADAGEAYVAQHLLRMLQADPAVPERPPVDPWAYGDFNLASGVLDGTFGAIDGYGWIIA